MGSRRWKAGSAGPSTNTSTGSPGDFDEDRGSRVRERDRRAPREAPDRGPGGAPDRVPRDRGGGAVRLLLPRRGRPERGERRREAARRVRRRGRRAPERAERRELLRADLLLHGEAPPDPVDREGEREAQRAADNPAVLLSVPVRDEGGRGPDLRADTEVRPGRDDLRGREVPRPPGLREAGGEAVRDLRTDGDREVDSEQADLLRDPREGRGERPPVRHALRVRRVLQDGLDPGAEVLVPGQGRDLLPGFR